MKTLNEAKETIKPHRRELEDRFKVRQMGIFGSYVRVNLKKKATWTYSPN